MEQIFAGSTCRNFGLWCPEVEKDQEGIKNCGRQKQKYNLLYLLALIITFQDNSHNNQIVVTPNEMVGLYCRD